MWRTHFAWTQDHEEIYLSYMGYNFSTARGIEQLTALSTRMVADDCRALKWLNLVSVNFLISCFVMRQF
jgi:hypothetical protein